MFAPRLALAFVLLAPPVLAQGTFVNWESPHVSPLTLTPDGTRLLAVNTADNRLEVFDATRSIPLWLASVPVGLDPVSVRARTDNEVWVVNRVSDTVSVVDLTTLTVMATLRTDDEPGDVVFAGAPLRAFVSCSQPSTVLVFDPLNLAVAPTKLALKGQGPRAMAVSADLTKVYVAIFESGNRSTVLGGGIDTSAGNIGFPPNVVNHASGPWGGVNPPPNDGTAFKPPINPALGPAPKVSLIVKQDDADKWMDDNGGDWTALVSGPNASLSGRLPGWTLLDHDVAIIDTAGLSIGYAGGLMNICMGLAVNPASGEVTVVGTDATNEVRFEPNLEGVFLRVNLGRLTGAGTKLGVADLNDHLDYSVPSLPQSERDKALGDPRAILWNSTGTRGWVAGMGSNNLIVIDPAGNRIGLAPTIEVGEGPTGLALHASTSRLFVLNKFEASISVVNVASEVETARVPFHDPTPASVSNGRVALYGTHENSGLGQIACASCHVDARNDRLAWDLGDPSGSSKALGASNLGANLPGLNTGFLPWHPMKGPMTTQTLQDIIGHEPLHWRGDRFGLEEFSGAFVGLQGDDLPLSAQEMQAFEDFLDSITIPPNPHRNLDNTLPTDLPLPGRHTSGRFGPAGQPLPNGNPQNGLALYRPPNLLDGGALACSTCHTMPTGTGTDFRRQGSVFVPIAPGPNGERHHMLVSVDGTTNRSIKVPQLRTLIEKDGFDCTQLENTSGFGLLHDGSVDSVERFIAEPVFTVTSDQQVADLTAFMLCFSGSDLPSGSTTTLLEPPGTASRDTHAAVGRQTTLTSAPADSASQMALIDDLIDLAGSGSIGLVAKGNYGGIPRGFAYEAAGGVFQSDLAAQAVTSATLFAAAAPGAELTFTAVPAGSQVRIGIDRDLDGFFDQDEIVAGSDPANAASTPGGCAKTAPSAPLALSATGIGSDRMNLTWSDVATDEDGYTVERALAGSGDWQVVATLPADSTSYPDTPLPCATAFAWRVSASNCAGASGFALVLGTTGGCCPVSSYCIGAPNSAGPGALIGSSGSTSVAAADFVLQASGAVPGNLGLFFYAPVQQAPTPFGDGFLCINSGGVGLFRILPSDLIDPTGNVTHPLDFTSPPVGSGPGMITAGSNWNFQFWYRDPAAGGFGFNVSDALSVSFCP